MIQFITGAYEGWILIKKLRIHRSNLVIRWNSIYNKNNKSKKIKSNIKLGYETGNAIEGILGGVVHKTAGTVENTKNTPKTKSDIYIPKVYTSLELYNLCKSNNVILSLPMEYSQYMHESVIYTFQKGSFKKHFTITDIRAKEYTDYQLKSAVKAFIKDVKLKELALNPHTSEGLVFLCESYNITLHKINDGYNITRYKLVHEKLTEVFEIPIYGDINKFLLGAVNLFIDKLKNSHTTNKTKYSNIEKIGKPINEHVQKCLYHALYEDITDLDEFRLYYHNKESNFRFKCGEYYILIYRKDITTYEDTPLNELGDDFKIKNNELVYESKINLMSNKGIEIYNPSKFR